MNEPGTGESLGEEAESDDELVGMVLDGRFRIEELIGAGGMGRVYRGSQLSVDREVAVKVLHGELSIDEELKKRFFREAKVVSDFTHPNIVRLIDFGRDEEFGLLYLVMDLVRGIGLDDLLEHGRLRPELALRIAHQTAGALVEAHGAGVIHRDLKAENLLLDPVADGTLQTKVVDFGIAYPEKASEKLTRTGRIYGTASYMAPEQAQGHEVDRRADLFSLGVLMFEMLTGKLPIEGTSSIEVMIKQIQEGPPPLSDVLSSEELPAGVFELVDSLLAGSPDARPNDAAEVRNLLEDLFRETGWQPIRLDTERPTVEMFEPWLQPPLEIDEAQAIERPAGGRGIDSKAETPKLGRENSEVSSEDGTGTGAVSGTAATADAAGGSPGTPTGGGEGPGAGGTDGSATPASGAQPQQQSEESNRGLLMLAIVLGLVLVVLIPVAAYVGLVYFRAEPGDSLEAATPSAVDPDGGSDESGEASDEASEKAAAAGEDPVCGSIERAKLPEEWRGTYRARSGEGADTTLKAGAKKLHARWSGGGATLWIAKSSDGDGEFRIGCARFTGSGSGDRCSGTLRRHGPVLIVRLEGTETCKERFSGSWVQK